MKPIAYIKNGFKDKFGVPRQSGRSNSISKIVFEKEFSSPEAIKGIEGYSHLWLIFEFSKTNGKYLLSVRPPRLGGNKKMGVFATRSPFRPNSLGLSSVELIKVENGVLTVKGADLIDGTPIYDIKPYLTFTDCHPNARCGFAEDYFNYKLTVQNVEVLDGVDIAIKEDIIDCLSNDPRPSYQDDKDRVYFMNYENYEVSFTVDGGNLYIKEVKTRP